MATTTTTTESKSRKVCFSFAAYSKNVIDHLKSCKVPVSHGLTDDEFSSIQSLFAFTFPPDLRSILCEGLPLGPGFPNWRSSSVQQLQILINLPNLGVSKELANGNFWCEAWGEEPDDPEQALTLAKTFFNAKAPLLVPIYQNCYISSVPNLAGNPVFYIHGGDLRYLGYDVAGFFQQIEFRGKQIVIRPARVEKSADSASVNAPAWAATTARRIAVWSELVESGTCGKRGSRAKWKSALGDYFEEISWKLKEGGWSDEQVREMIDGGQQEKERLVSLRDRESVEWHLRFLSLSLVRGGWSKEDVSYSFGFEHQGVVPEPNNASSLNVDNFNSNSLQAHLMLLPP